MLFVREVSLAMRDIFGKPHDKVVGELAGLAFETKPLTVRDRAHHAQENRFNSTKINAQVRPVLVFVGLRAVVIVCFV